MSKMTPPPLHPHEAFNRIEQQLATKVAEVQTTLQLAMLDATTSAAEVEFIPAHDPSALARRDRLLRNIVLVVAADLLLSKLYKELK